MATRFALLCVLLNFSFFFSSSQKGIANFWYTCDFHLEPDPDVMSEECRKIYSNKVGASDVYEFYKTEAKLFYRFRNKLVECESNARTCTYGNNSALAMPLLIGYDIKKRVRLYEESAMNECYLKANNNIEFINCIIRKRKKLLVELNQVCAKI